MWQSKGFTTLTVLEEWFFFHYPFLEKATIKGENQRLKNNRINEDLQCDHSASYLSISNNGILDSDLNLKCLLKMPK